MSTPYIVHTAAGDALFWDRGRAEQYAVDHHGTIAALYEGEDAVRLDWLAAGGLVTLMNAMVGDWDGDVLAFGCATGRPAVFDIRAEIDRLRAAPVTAAAPAEPDPSPSTFAPLVG